MSDNTSAKAEELDRLARQIREEHEAAGNAMQSVVEHAIAAGELLIEAKAQIKHGQWLNWLEENCQIGERTAQRYIRVAKYKDELADALKSDTVSLFKINDALKIISEKRTSEEIEKDKEELSQARYERELEEISRGGYVAPAPCEDSAVGEIEYEAPPYDDAEDEICLDDCKPQPHLDKNWQPPPLEPPHPPCVVAAHALLRACESICNVFAAHSLTEIIIGCQSDLLDKEKVLVAAQDAQKHLLALTSFPFGGGQ